MTLNWYYPIGVIDRLANELEDFVANIPVLRYTTYTLIGDPASWFFSHPAFVLLLVWIGSLFGSPFAGAVVANAIYVPREAVDAHRNYTQVGWAGFWRRLPVRPHRGLHVGWGTDGIGDLTVAAMTLWWTWPR